MFSVIPHDKWLQWCEKKQLDVDHARFALDTCYYGVDLRSRPGTLIVNDDGILHHSYSVSDTLMAIFESSTKVEMPIKQIISVRQKQLTPLMNAMLIVPDAYFQVEMEGGEIHHLALQRDGDKFVEAVSGLDIPMPESAVDSK